MFGIRAALEAALGAALAASIAFGVWQSWQLQAAREKGVRTRLELGACSARLGNLIRDLESDNAIDALPDDALTTVPPGWLLRP